LRLDGGHVDGFWWRASFTTRDYRQVWNVSLHSLASFVLVNRVSRIRRDNSEAKIISRYGRGCFMMFPVSGHFYRQLSGFHFKHFRNRLQRLKNHVAFSAKSNRFRKCECNILISNESVNFKSHHTLCISALHNRRNNQTSPTLAAYSSHTLVISHTLLCVNVIDPNQPLNMKKINKKRRKNASQAATTLSLWLNHESL
jgi:hypothetical protein